MSIPSLNLKQARLINLEAQGLLTPPSSPATKSDVLCAIQCIGSLQIDTIHVVARSPYFVLFSRVGNYQPGWLDELQAERSILEQWAHEASYVPMEDYPLHRQRTLEGLRRAYFHGWAVENWDKVNTVLDAVCSNGEVRSADFKTEKRPGGWWNWKFEKAALEYWFNEGKLLVVRRENFQRVYDLHERVLPDWDDSKLPSVNDAYCELILKTVRALGVARPAWIADYFRINKKTVANLLPGLVSSGQLCEVAVEGWAEPALFLPEKESILRAALDGALIATYTTLLSPFDPLVWDRARTRQLFNFVFTIQCYLPAEKRTYGYFPLPILHNGEIIGRLDAKAHRKEGLFEVKSIYFEKNVRLGDDMVTALANAVFACAAWHQTPHVVLTRCDPPEHESVLQSAFSSHG